MNVKIKTAFGEMSFDMIQENALKLINQAISYASQPDAKAEEPVKSVEKPTPQPVENATNRNRTETMFGKREGWNMPAADQGQSTKRNSGGPEARGFLYVQCEACGNVKGFLARHALKYHQCECGHKTELHGLRFAHVKCKCGKDFDYVTNLQSDFTIDCLSCGSPVDMELGAKGTAFVTVGQKYARGGGCCLMVNLMFSDSQIAACEALA